MGSPSVHAGGSGILLGHGQVMARSLIRIGLVISAEVWAPPACGHLWWSVGLRTQPAAGPVA